jgi:penicillin-binding protein 1A
MTATSSTTSTATPRRRKRVLSEQAAASMNSMLVQIPEIGTLARRKPGGLRPASARRQDRHDAVLSRRLVCRLHRQLHRRRVVRQRRLTSTNNMTGGSLPAMTWQKKRR